MRKLVMRHTLLKLISLQLSGMLLIIVSLTISSGTIHAQSTDNSPSFALQPTTYDARVPATKSYFVLETKAGTTLSQSVRVTNVGTATGSVRLYPVSATTAPTGGIAFLSQHDPLRDVAAWIKLGQQQLTLAPGQSQVVSFQVAVPASARSGEHVSAITAENLTLQKSSSKNSLQIDVQSLSIMAVQVNIPGPRIEQMKITGIQAGGSNGYQSLLIGMANTGNQMLKPYGTLSVSNAQGQPLQSLNVKLNTILPDTSIDYPAYVQKQALAPGDYQVSLHLNYGHSKRLDYTSKLTITQKQVDQAFSNSPLKAPTSAMPLWQIILVALAAIILLLTAGQKLRGWFSSRRQQPEKHTPLTDSYDQPMDILTEKVAK